MIIEDSESNPLVELAALVYKMDDARTGHAWVPRCNVRNAM